MAATRSQSLLKEAMMNQKEEVSGSRLENLQETIDDKQAKIGDRIHALLLLLRSKHSEGENLQVDSIPTSLQLPESPDFNRPDPKPNYVINASADVTKASSPLPNRTIKCHRRISLEEIEERRLKGLCLFCEESETPDHYLLHKNSGILMIDSDEDRFLIDKELVETDVGVSSEMLRNGKYNPPQAATGFELDVGGTQSLNQDRLKLCAENKGCLGCSQALVLVKGITERSSSAKELMKEEPDFVNVNEVKMERQIVGREMSPSITVLETGTKGMIGSHATTAFVFKQTAISYYQCSEHNLFSTMLLGLQSKQKQRKCPKSWMFKFKTGSKPVGTSHLNLYKECGLCVQIRGVKKQSKLLLLSLCPSFVCRAVLRVIYWKLFGLKALIGLEIYSWEYKKQPKSEKSSFQRTYTAQIRRCEETAQQICFFTDQMSKPRVFAKQIQTLQDLQQFTLGEVRFHIKHKWRFKLLHLVSELNFSFESVASVLLSDDQCDHCVVARTCCVWTTQMLFGSESNHVWHRWKARYSQNFDSRVWDPGG